MRQVNDTSLRRHQAAPISAAEHRLPQLSADMPRRRVRWVRIAVPGLLVLALALGSQSIQPSTAASNAEEWTTVNKDYSSQRYVNLDQINPGTVGALKQVCEAQLQEPSWFSSGMLMVGRTLYVSTLRATYAVDAATCDVRWRHVLQLGKTANVGSRGLGYLDGMVFRGTADGRVLAFDAETGKVMWDVSRLTPRPARCCAASTPAGR